MKHSSQAEYPAPSILRADGDVVRYEDQVSGAVHVKVGPYEGMAIGQTPVVFVKLNSGGSVNFQVVVKEQRELKDGVVGGFERGHLIGSTSLEVRFTLDAQPSLIRTYEVQAPAS
jgi:hypothetical protein